MLSLTATKRIDGICGASPVPLPFHCVPDHRHYSHISCSTRDCRKLQYLAKSSLSLARTLPPLCLSTHSSVPLPHPTLPPQVSDADCRCAPSVGRRHRRRGAPTAPPDWLLGAATSVIPAPPGQVIPSNILVSRRPVSRGFCSFAGVKRGR